MATIAAKLAASEREADAARVRAKLRAARSAGKKLNTLATGAPVLTHPTRGPSDGGGVSLEPSAEAHRQNGTNGKQDMQYDDDDDDEDNDNADDDDDDDDDNDDDVDNEEAIEEDELKDEPQQSDDQDLVVVKRKRGSPRAVGGKRVASTAAHRRRSTLSPWELQSLMTGSAATAPPVPSATRS
jgi:hypothetical protein